MSDPCVSTGIILKVYGSNKNSRYLWTRRVKHQWVLLRSVLEIIISYFLTTTNNRSSGNEGVGGFDVCMTLRIKHGKDSQPYFRG